MKTATQTTLRSLNQGTIINYYDIYNNTDFVVLNTYSNNWGTFTRVLNLETTDVEEITSHTLIGEGERHTNWSIVKEN